jgi:uncharacterized protein involved in response to NO
MLRIAPPRDEGVRRQSSTLGAASDGPSTISGWRASAARARSWRGAAILARGFRPFFLAAGAWAVTRMAVWPSSFEGRTDVPTAFSPVDWHAHEMTGPRARPRLAIHFKDARSGLASFSIHAALAVIVMLILLIGGRAVPSFTRNWLATIVAARRPVPLGRADSAMMAVSGLSLALWVAEPEGSAKSAPSAGSQPHLFSISRYIGMQLFVLHLI